jgi:hypothetical protein
LDWSSQRAGSILPHRFSEGRYSSATGGTPTFDPLRITATEDKLAAPWEISPRLLSFSFSLFPLPHFLRERVFLFSLVGGVQSFSNI